MKKTGIGKALFLITLLAAVLSGIAVVSGCSDGANRRESAYVFLPEELPEGVMSLEVIPYKSVTDKDGNENVYVERNKDYALRVVLAEGYEPGEMKINVCGTPRNLDIYRIEKNVIYQVNNLVAPGAIDIDVEFVGAPAKVTSDIKLGYEAASEAISASAYNNYEVEFDAGLFGIEAEDDVFTLGEFRELFRSTTNEELSRGEFAKIRVAPAVEWGECVTFTVRSDPEYKYVFVSGGVMSVINDANEPYPYGFDKSNVNSVTVSETGSVVYSIDVRSYVGEYRFRESNFGVEEGKENLLGFRIGGKVYTDVREAGDGYFTFDTSCGGELEAVEAGGENAVLRISCLKSGENEIYDALYSSLKFYINGEAVEAEKEGDTYNISLQRPYEYGEDPYERFTEYRLSVKTSYEGEEYDFYSAPVAAGLAEKSSVSLNSVGYGEYKVEYAPGSVAFETAEGVYVESGKPTVIKITLPDGTDIREVTELVFNGNIRVASGGEYEGGCLSLVPEVNENYFTLTVAAGYKFNILTVGTGIMPLRA